MIHLSKSGENKSGDQKNGDKKTVIRNLGFCIGCDEFGLLNF